MSALQSEGAASATATHSQIQNPVWNVNNGKDCSLNSATFPWIQQTFECIWEKRELRGPRSNQLVAKCFTQWQLEIGRKASVLAFGREIRHLEPQKILSKVPKPNFVPIFWPKYTLLQKMSFGFRPKPFRSITKLTATKPVGSNLVATIDCTASSPLAYAWMRITHCPSFLSRVM